MVVGQHFNNDQPIKQPPMHDLHAINSKTLMVTKEALLTLQMSKETSTILPPHLLKKLFRSPNHDQ